MRRKYRTLSIVLASLLMVSTIGFIPANAQDNLPDTGIVEEVTEPSVEFTEKYASVGTTMGAIVSNIDNYSLMWYVNDVLVSTEDTYTITESDIETFLTVNVISNDEIVLTKSIYCSELPVIYIDCNDIDTQNPWNSKVSKDNYSTATMRIQGNSTYTKDKNLYNGDIKIKGRGTSTWSWDKKPYKLKLDSKTSLFGMGKNKHWVLLANYVDGTLMRNYSAYNLAKGLNQVAMDSVLVDVVINGSYVGNYQLCEQIRVTNDRVDIYDYENVAEQVADSICQYAGIIDKETIKSMEDAMTSDLSWMTSDTFTFDNNTYTISEIYMDWNTLQEKINNVDGYLLELATDSNAETSYFSTPKNNYVSCAYPEFLKTNQIMMNNVQNKVSNFETAIYSDTGNISIDGELVPYNDLCDMDSLLGYWTVCMIYMNEIGHRSNYMYLKDGILTFGPVWDFDWSSGSDAPEVASWPSLPYNSWINGNGSWWATWFSQVGNNPYFAIKEQEYYLNNKDIINSYLDVNNPDSFINTTYKEIYTSAKANDEVWTNVSFEESYQNFTNWISNRLSWIDEQFATENSAVSSLYTGYGDVASSNLSITIQNDDGSYLEADDISKVPGSGKVENGKDIQISINDSWNNNAWNTCYLDIYVNNHLIDTIKYNNDTTTYTITSDKLNSDINTKNVIQVYTKGSADSTYYTSKNFATVVKYGDTEEPPVIEDTFEITSQPIDFKGNIGNTATFNIVATGDILSYQWQYSKDGSSWYKSTSTGNTTDTLSFPIKSTSFNNYYRCVITDNNGNKITSNSVQVINPIAITSQPTNFKGSIGSTATFNVVATGDTLSYQWQYSKDGLSWYKSTSTGNTTDTLSFPIKSTSLNNYYRCVVTDSNGNKITSNSVQIVNPITITSQPTNFKGSIGSTATFNVVATGDTLSYQWQYSKDGSNWYKSTSTGNTTDILSFPIKSTSFNNYYRCVVTDNNGNKVISNSVQIVNPIAITSQPINFKGSIGNTATFNVVATGDTLSYQWQYSKDGLNWYKSTSTGNTTDTLSFPIKSTSFNNYYRCVITDKDNNKIISDICNIIS